MAQCHAEGKKHPTNGMDLYAGIFNGKVYSSNRTNGHADHYQNWSSDSFRKEISTERHSPYGGSFREDKTKSGAFSQANEGFGVIEANNVRNGSYYRAGSDHTVHRSFNQSCGLVVGASKAGGGLSHGVDSRNGCLISGASITCDSNGNARKKESGDLAISRRPPIGLDGSRNELIVPKKENGDLANVRGTKSFSGELTKWEARSATSDSALAVAVANENLSAARIQKSGEMDVLNSDCASRNQKSGELNGIGWNGGTRAHISGEQNVSWLNGGTRLHKSGEQNIVSSNGGTGFKGSPNGGNLTSLKGSPINGNHAGGHGFGDSSSNGGSSNGSSPTAEAAKGGRLSSVGSTMSNGSSPTSVSSRGVGNITGNLGNLKLSGSKAVSNENLPSTPAVMRSGSGSTRKSGEMLPNSSGNLRGVSTSRVSAEGNPGGGIVTGINSVAIAKGTTRSSPPRSNGTGSVGNLCRGNWNGNMLNGGNLSNGNVINGAGACKLNGRAATSNGNVLSYGAGMKSNSKLVEGNRNGMEFYRAASADPEEIKNAGNEHYKRGQFPEALVLYDRAIALCSSNAAYRSNRAAALTGLCRLGEAAQECQEAIRLDPGYNRAHQRIASLYLRFGLVESAKRHFQAAGQQTDLGDVQRLQDIERHISRCIEARKMSDWRKVIRESDAAVVAGADSAPQVFGYKSEALLKLHILDEADEVCTASQRVESSLIKTGVVPADSFLLIIRAEIDMVLGRFERAIQAAESAARIDSRSTEVIALLRKARAVCQSRTSGNECFKAGRFFEACALYCEGLESDPTNAVLLCNRAACRSKLGQWEKAVEDCNAALNVQPNYTKALMRRAICSIQLERWEDALRDYEALRRELPSDMEVARALFDVQVAIKKSRGEEIYKMKFGGDVEVVSNNEQFREAVTSPGLAVVQFNTRCSDRCRQISPFVDQLCKRFPCVNFLKVDVDDNPYLAKTESVSFVPTFKIYKNGQKVKDILGPSQQALEYAVKHYSL